MDEQSTTPTDQSGHITTSPSMIGQPSTDCNNVSITSATTTSLIGQPASDCNNVSITSATPTSMIGQPASDCNNVSITSATPTSMIGQPTADGNNVSITLANQETGIYVISNEITSESDVAMATEGSELSVTENVNSRTSGDVDSTSEGTLVTMATEESSASVSETVMNTDNEFLKENVCTSTTEVSTNPPESTNGRGFIGPCIPDQSEHTFPINVTNEVETDSIMESEETMETQWTINYDFDRKPECILTESEEFNRSDNNYLKGCKWSPDGACLLTNSNDNKLRLYNLPNQLWNNDHKNLDRLDLALSMSEGSLIYDYCWYPLMTSSMPESCCLASTSRGIPIHLWDAFTGELRCVYRVYDHMDELISAKTLAFNNAGDKLFCGFEKSIRVFHTARPGRDYETYDYKSTKKRQVRGQAGIMSSIAFHPDDSMFAVGTYGKTVGLYSTETGKCALILRGHASGVTQVRFLSNGNHVLSGTRRDSDIFCWDIRYTRAPAYRMQRLVCTNQRMQFDVDRSGRYLVSGNHNGKITIWDLEKSLLEESDILRPLTEFQGHWDTVNGTNFHPFLPILATASGQHREKLSQYLTSDGDSDSSSNEDDVNSSIMNKENSVKLWWLGSEPVAEKCE